MIEIRSSKDWRAAVDAVLAALRSCHGLNASVEEIRRLRPGRDNAVVLVQAGPDGLPARLLLETSGQGIAVSRPCPEGRHEFGGWDFLAEGASPEAAAKAVYAGALLAGV